MDFDTIRPVLSGLAGGAIAIWICAKWARWVPRAADIDAAQALVATHRAAIYAANAAFMAGMVTGMGLYWLAGFKNNDWRPLGLGFGGGALGALIMLATVSLLTARSAADAYVAYAIYQKSPMVVLYSILGLGVAAFFGAVYSLLR